jgi:hypothetical protein
MTTLADERLRPLTSDCRRYQQNPDIAISIKSLCNLEPLAYLSVPCKLQVLEMREVGFEEELLYKVNGGGEPGEDNGLNDSNK